MNDALDVAVIGAGAAGTFAADAMKERHPEWSIVLFERRRRVGGRLWSVPVPGLEQPIELGGMRSLTSHHRVEETYRRLGIPTHPFGGSGGGEQSYLRGHFGDGPRDASAGAGYDLPPEERDRPASDLASRAFERAIATPPDPGNTAAWATIRGTARYLDRRVVDWPIGDALATTLSPEGRQFVTDAFGYDAGVRMFNLGDAVQYLLGGGDPRATAVTPDQGMDAIPKELARRFEAAGGVIRLGHDLANVVLNGEDLRISFANGTNLHTRRLVLAVPFPALSALTDASPLLSTPAFRGLFDAAEPISALKLYLWFDRPWWRDAITGMRMTTDLPVRKLHYFDTEGSELAALLACYTDGLHAEPWRGLVDGAAMGGHAPAAMQATAMSHLQALHPQVPAIPAPVGSAFMFWGADERETGWTFWRAGVVSDTVMAAAIQPEPSLPVYVCGEAFSRAQGWVEGALETAEAVVDRITG